MPRTAAFETLAESLRERRLLIADRDFYERDREGHLAQLAEVSGRIVELSNALPAPLNPELGHFLQRCSYDKALAWLEAHAAADDRPSNRAP